MEVTRDKSVLRHGPGEPITNWYLGRIKPTPTHVPDGWELVPLTEVAALESGHTPSRMNPEYWDGPIPWVSLHDSKNLDVPEIETTAQSVTELGIAKSPARVLPKGTVVFSRTATVGKATVLGGEMATSQDFANYICGDHLYNRYLVYLFRYMQPEWNRLMAGSTHNTIYMPVFRDLQILLPPSNEQRAIAEALSDADSLIGALDKLIAKKRAIKQAAMQQLLTGKTRLPGFNGEWETKRLGNVVDRVIGGGTPSRSNQHYWGQEIPWTTVKDFATFDSRKTQESITAAGLTNSASNLIPAGTLIVSTRMALGKAVIYEVDVSINQDLKALFCKKSVSTQYLFYWFMAHAQMIDELGSGSTVKGLSSDDLRAITSDFPPIDEQQAIATILSDMDAEIAALERRRDKTKAIKQGMMQELLTGRTRLVKPQATVAKAESQSGETRGHSQAFNEAVVISVLANQFGSEQFPLGRKRYTKLSYLLHRRTDQRTEGYLKKAAGPYNPRTKYGGPEKIALENGYIHEHRSGRFKGFVAADNIAQAESYFAAWYGSESAEWLEQFRFKKNDDLELLATVDMAVEELRTAQKAVDVESVKNVIRANSEWKAKLDRPLFSEANIAQAIETCRTLFGQ